VFGEEALISGAKRNATVMMQSDGVLLRLGREDFMTLLKEPLLHKSSYEKAIQAVNQGAVWLDVRYPPEFRHDRLPGAMNVPLNGIRDAIGVLDRGKKYIAAARVASAAQLLHLFWRKPDTMWRFWTVVSGQCRERRRSKLARRTGEVE